MNALTTTSDGLRSSDWLLRQLPSGLLSEDFFVRFVSLFQAEADTLLAHGDNLPHLADVTLAPPPMVRELGRWIGLRGVDEGHDETHQRRLVAEAARALLWRGTATGLRRILRAHTGVEPRIREGGGVFEQGQSPEDPAWVEVRLPGSGPVAPAAIVEIIRDEVPAHVRLTVWVADEQLWPRTDDLGAPTR